MRADGRTDRHDEAKSRFSQFYERAQKKNEWRYASIPLIPLYEFTCYQYVGLRDQYEQYKCGLLQVKSLLLNLPRRRY